VEAASLVRGIAACANALPGNANGLGEAETDAIVPQEVLSDYQKKPRGEPFANAEATTRATARTAGNLLLQCNMGPA
jgi:hypothetical protein